MPPRVAPQQVVVIPIPNAKMTGDDKQVPTCVTKSNNYVCLRMCTCVSVCSFSVCLHVLPVGPDAKQPAVVTCMALGFSAWTLDPSCSCITPTTSHHTASHVYAFLPDTVLVISNCQIQIQESDSRIRFTCSL